MRISDWSSDVCSSDRVATETPPPRATLAPPVTANRRRGTRCVTPQFHIPRPALPGRPVKTAAVRPGNVTGPAEIFPEPLRELLSVLDRAVPRGCGRAHVRLPIGRAHV